MKKKLLWTTLFIVIASVVQRYFFGQYFLKSDLLNSLTTFLSVIFGFYITSLAIFVTSHYVAELYRVTDKNNPSLTLLHSLIANYKFGLISILISIVYFLVIQMALNQQVSDPKIPLSDPFALPFLGAVICNVWYSYRMLNDLIKIIVQEAKRGA